VTWLAAEAEGTTPFDRALGLRPELLELFGQYYGQLWDDQLVDPVLIELCRIRIAQLQGDAQQALLRYEPAMAAGLTEEKVAELPRYYASPLYTAHERNCLNYAEKYVIDVHSLTDEDAAKVKEEMDDPGFVAFTVALGLLDGIGRFRVVLGVDATDTPALDQPVVVPAPAAGQPLH
jgi:alkylhydroperoxidase family enzyme